MNDEKAAVHAGSRPKFVKDNQAAEYDDGSSG